MDSISIDRTASAPPASSDPFDFSDFGSRASGDPIRSAIQPQPDVASGGFDPFAGQAPAATATADMGTFTGFQSAAPVTAFEVAGPPLRLFAVAFAVAVLGTTLTLLTLSGAQDNSSAVLAFIGWLLAGPAAIGVLAWCSRLDTRRRLSAVYSAPAWLRPVYWVVLATCAAGIGTGAWQLALWAGRF